MSRHTRCGRCGGVGAYRDDNRTFEFPSVTKITDFSDYRTPTAGYVLCSECAVELAVFLGDEEMADTLWETYNGDSDDERVSGHCEDGGGPP